MMNHNRRTYLAGLLAAGLFTAAGQPGYAQEAPALFEVVTVSDTIVVALSAQDALDIGGEDITHIGQALVGRGELTVWRYAVRKGADGSLEQAPLNRVSLLHHDSLRIVPVPGD